jgi:hypothetical protein
MFPEKPQLPAGFFKGFFQLDVGRLNASAPGYDHQIQPTTKSAFVQAINLPQSPAHPIPHNGLPDLVGHRDPQAIARAACPPDIQHKIRRDRAFPFSVQPTELIVLFESFRKLHWFHRIRACRRERSNHFLNGSAAQKIPLGLRVCPQGARTGRIPSIKSPTKWVLIES